MIFFQDENTIDMPYMIKVIRYSKWVMLLFGFTMLFTSWLFVIKPYETKQLQAEALSAAERFIFDFSTDSTHSLDAISVVFSELEAASFSLQDDIITALDGAFKEIHGLESFVFSPKSNDGLIEIFNPYERYPGERAAKERCDIARAQGTELNQYYRNMSILPVDGVLCVYNQASNMLAILNIKATLHAALEAETTKGYFRMLMDDTFSEVALHNRLSNADQMPLHLLGTDWNIYAYPSEAYTASRMKETFWTFCMVLLSGSGLFSWWFLRQKRKRNPQLSTYEVEHLKKLALYDTVTSLPNRRYCLDHLNTLIAHTKDSGFSVCFIDCNHFKQINDDYGHAAGDRVLQHIANKISKVIQKNDFLARYSGDEFCLILENTTKSSDIKAALEKILKAVATPVNVDGKMISVSISIGVAVYPTAGTSAQLLIEHADSAMYQAKRDSTTHYLVYTETRV